MLRVFMEKQSSDIATQLIKGLGSFLRRCTCSILSAGRLPRHVAFIMDGNRRYAKKQCLLEGAGHRAGSLALTNMLRYCYELNVKYVTVYAFSIENFKRRPVEVQSMMQLILEKIEALLEKESIVNQYGVRVYFVGNLKLLSRDIKVVAERDCNEPVIDVGDVEKHMYMAVAPDPDVIIRSSGETRLSNFLLWQSGSSLLYSSRALWPEIGFWHLVRAILDFQRNVAYLENKRKER